MPLDFPDQVTATDPNVLLGANDTAPAKTPINSLGRDLINTTAAGARTSLGLGSLATQNNIPATGISDSTATGRGVVTAANPAAARAILEIAADYRSEALFVEEFCGTSGFVDGLAAAVAGGGVNTQRNGGGGDTTGIMELSSGTTSGASALGRIVAAPVAGAAAQRFVQGSGVRHFFGFRVAAASAPGTLTTDDSHLLVGLGTSGSSIGTAQVEFAAVNGDNWICRVLNAGTGSFTTSLPARVTLANATTNTNTTINLANTTGLSVGMPIAGPGIPNGAVITAIVPNTSLTINLAATASATVTLFAGIWYNFGIFYDDVTGRVQFYNGATLLGEIGPGSTTPGTNTTIAIPVGLFPRMMAFRERATTSDFRLFVDTYVHRIIYGAARWPTV